MAEIVLKKLKSKTGTEIILRTPRPEEAEVFLATMKQVMTESDYLLTEPDEFTITVEKEAELLATYLNHEDRIWIVPEVNGKIVGALNFAAGGRRRNQHQGSLGMSLLKQYRGHGIGSLMFEALFDWVLQHPRIETIRLDAADRNDHALNLYRKVGFVEEGRQRKGMKFSDGTYCDIIQMARQVK